MSVAPQCTQCFGRGWLIVRGRAEACDWHRGGCRMDNERKSEAAVQSQEQQREPIAHSEQDDQKDQTVTPQKRPEESPKERE
jgi:hypothetical protein